MFHSDQYYRRTLVALSAVAGFALLSGCQGHKIVAKINGTPIEDSDYQAYVSRVQARDFTSLSQQGVQTDAGGVGLVTLIKERLLDRLAADKNIHITDEAVARYVEYMKRTTPDVLTALGTGTFTKDDLPRIFRDQMLLLALGTDNASVSEDDLKKELADNHTAYDYPEIDGIRIVAVPDQTQGIELLNQIKASGDFGASAAKFNAQAGTIHYIRNDNPSLPSALKDALTPLKDGQVVSAPISFTNPQAPNSPPTFLVVQLVQRSPKGEAKLDEAREAIRQKLLQKTHPDIGTHVEDLMADYNKKANVEVFIDRYKDMVKTAIVPPANPMRGMSPSGMRPAGPSTGAIRPGGPAVRVAPSGTPAPANGTAPAPKKP